MRNKRNQSVLTIVIPALNEEQAIGNTIKRCLAAREIIHQAGVSEVEVIVVSDGSVDRTAQIAQSFREVTTIVFPKNRGYGAAIQEGFSRGKGDLLAFIDADGTCDPAFFATLCRAILEEDAEIALGSRLDPSSKMPLIRRIGNLGYALILGWICGKSIEDTASGMRVIRRDALQALGPLPAGLQFTPSMSAKSLLLGQNIKEIPMSYSERVGRSKLNVLRDGVRFLRVILAATLVYRPERILVPFASWLSFVLMVLAISPIEIYSARGVLQDWMLYRFLVCMLLSTLITSVICATAIIEKTRELSPGNRAPATFWSGLFLKIIQSSWFTYALAAVFVSAIWMVWPGLVEYVRSRTVSLHWSRCVIAGGFIVSIFQVAITRVVLKILALKAYHLAPLSSATDETAERFGAARRGREETSRKLRAS